MSGDQAKVKRYYKKFRNACESLDRYIAEVGEILFENNYTKSSTAFSEELEDRTDTREAARLQLERVVREEKVSVGPIVVENRTTVSYDGEYLFNLFADDEETRDQLVEVVYKVKPATFNRLATEGRIAPKDINKAVVARKQTVALKGLPQKVGLG